MENGKSLIMITDSESSYVSAAAAVDDLEEAAAKAEGKRYGRDIVGGVR